MDTNASFKPRRGLRVRHRAAEMCQAVFLAADQLPAGRKGAFADQIRRAAASVHTNLAEGEARTASRDRAHFFTIAWASLVELEAHLDLARGCGGLTPAIHGGLRTHCRHVGRMLHALRSRVATTGPTPLPPPVPPG